MSKSPIEWTEHTWNPIVGCSIVSPGCTNCYAMKMAARIEAMDNQPRYAGTTRKVNGNAVWTGKLAMAPDDAFLAPLRRKKPTVYFVNSMGDLFHEDAPDKWIDRVFAIMALCPQHTFQVLTKRAERMREYCASDATLGRIVSLTGFLLQSGGHCEVEHHADGLGGIILPNVWLGVSTERQQEADERIPLLLTTPAAVRFISAEPLLCAIDLTKPWAVEVVGNIRLIDGLDWVIVGGESGSGARPMHPDWARSLRDQCARADVPFFFKQWGAWEPHRPIAGGDLGGDVRAGRVRIVHPTGQSDVEVFQSTGGRNTVPGSRYMKLVGKKAAGRLLDGKQHNGFPIEARTNLRSPVATAPSNAGAIVP